MSFLKQNYYERELEQKNYINKLIRDARRMWLHNNLVYKTFNAFISNLYNLDCIEDVCHMFSNNVSYILDYTIIDPMTPNYIFDMLKDCENDDDKYDIILDWYANKCMMCCD